MTVNIGRACLTLALAVYGFICAIRPSEWHLINGANLIIHEAGHLLFGWFGTFIGIAGGTIAQLMLPSACSAYFLRYESRFASAATLWWLGQNLTNFSVYVKDARAMDLPLVSVGGGADTIHDWNFILGALGLLGRDQFIGGAILGLGTLIMLAAVGGMGYFSMERSQPDDRSTC